VYPTFSSSFCELGLEMASQSQWASACSMQNPAPSTVESYRPFALQICSRESAALLAVKCSVCGYVHISSVTESSFSVNLVLNLTKLVAWVISRDKVDMKLTASCFPSYQTLFLWSFKMKSIFTYYAAVQSSNMYWLSTMFLIHVVSETW
jgi:hypothetical protein